MTDSIHRHPQGAFGNGHRSEADVWFAEFVRLLERHRGLLGQIDALSHRQRSLIDADDAEGLLQVLRDRQSLIDALLGEQTMVDRMREDWRRVESSLPEECVETVRERLESIASLHDAISQRDEQDQASLRRRRDQVASELADLGVSRRALGAYGGPPAPAPKFQDREG